MSTQCCIQIYCIVFLDIWGGKTIRQKKKSTLFGCFSHKVDVPAYKPNSVSLRTIVIYLGV